MITLTAVTSICQYSARPVQTPQIICPSAFLCNLLFIVHLPFMMLMFCSVSASVLNVSVMGVIVVVIVVVLVGLLLLAGVYICIAVVIWVAYRHDDSCDDVG